MRVSSRAIIIENGKVLTMFRRKIKDGIVKEYDFNTLQNYVQTGQLPNNNSGEEEPAIRPRGNNIANIGQPARVEDYAQAPVQAPATRNRRTISNQGGY